MSLFGFSTKQTLKNSAGEKYKCKKIFGFSVAEAMVTLLIASIAVSAAAPVISKRNEIRTSSASSFWVSSRGLNNITRPRGKVGIGVPTNATPEAMLDIRSNADNFITIKRNGRDIFTVNNAGRLMIDIPGAANTRAISVRQNGAETVMINSNGLLALNTLGGANARMLSVRQNGAETAFVNSNGTAQFMVANLYRPAGATILQGGTDSANVSSWLNSNGTLTLAPLDAAAANRRAITIKKGNTDAMWFNTEGDLRIFKTTAGAAIQIGSDSTHINTTIRSDGQIILNAPGDTVVNAITIRQNGTNTLRIRSDGTSDLMPSGAVMFFDLANCPPGWTNLTERGWGGRYIRVAGAGHARGALEASAVGPHNHDYKLSRDIRYKTINYGGGGGLYTIILDGENQHYNWWKNGTSVVLKQGNTTGLAEETRPETVVLTACRRN